MRMFLPIGLLCGGFLLLGDLPKIGEQRPAFAQELDVSNTIAVDLASGRTFTAEVDPRTDSSELWLRSRRGGMTILRPVRWDRVVRARVGSDLLSGEQLRDIIDTVRRATPVAEPPDRAQANLVITGDDLKGRSQPGPSPPSMPAAVSRNSVPRSSVPRNSVLPRVRSLAIEANVANWDADVEVDGLLVRVYPLDGQGAVVPTRGTLEIDLTAQRTGVVRHPWPFVRAGRWTRQVRRADFGPSGVVYRLPFQSKHPEFDLDLAAYGEVHARLSVPGQGTFEATGGTTRIRPSDLMRDQLQQATGRRFFPQERTSGR